MVKSRRTGLAGHVAGMGTNSNTYSCLVIKSVGRKPIENPWPSWEHDNKLKEVWAGFV